MSFYDTLRQLWSGRPTGDHTFLISRIKLESAGSYRDFQAEYSIPASAKTGEGLAELKKGASRDRTKRTDLCGAFV